MLGDHQGHLRNLHLSPQATRRGEASGRSGLGLLPDDLPRVRFHVRTRGNVRVALEYLLDCRQAHVHLSFLGFLLAIVRGGRAYILLIWLIVSLAGHKAVNGYVDCYLKRK